LREKSSPLVGRPVGGHRDNKGGEEDEISQQPERGREEVELPAKKEEESGVDNDRRLPPRRIFTRGDQNVKGMQFSHR